MRWRRPPPIRRFGRLKEASSIVRSIKGRQAEPRRRERIRGRAPQRRRREPTRRFGNGIGAWNWNGKWHGCVSVTVTGTEKRISQGTEEQRLAARPVVWKDEAVT